MPLRWGDLFSKSIESKVGTYVSRRSTESCAFKKALLKGTKNSACAIKGFTSAFKEISCAFIVLLGTPA